MKRPVAPQRMVLEQPAQLAPRASDRPRHPSPPGPAAPREVRFPPVVRATTNNGLEVNVVELRRLPLVEVRLVVRGGSAADPSGMPGLARLVASMLREGTRTRSGARLAAEFESWGAELGVGSDQESVYISMRALSEYLPRTLSMVSEIAQRPAFGQLQLERLRRRELERLQL
ncbi:MAG: insulinase family protein, partial [Proteobacteria bacterium]|nr:insulinase family protein [Pseudomonadota bacterium]